MATENNFCMLLSIGSNYGGFSKSKHQELVTEGFW